MRLSSEIFFLDNDLFFIYTGGVGRELMFCNFLVINSLAPPRHLQCIVPVCACQENSEPKIIELFSKAFLKTSEYFFAMKTLNLVINYNAKVQFLYKGDSDGILDSLVVQSLDDKVRVVTSTVDEGMVYTKSDKYDDFVSVDARLCVTLEVEAEDEDLNEDFFVELVEGLLMLETNHDHYIVFDYDVYGWEDSENVLANRPTFA